MTDSGYYMSKIESEQNKTEPKQAKKSADIIIIIIIKL
jgi:hypothetical protein